MRQGRDTKEGTEAGPRGLQKRLGTETGPPTQAQKAGEVALPRSPPIELSPHPGCPQIPEKTEAWPTNPESLKRLLRAGTCPQVSFLKHLGGPVYQGGKTTPLG